MRRRVLILAVLASLGASIAQGQLDVIPGQAQGGRGDLVLMHGGTIEGVHVIQGGTRECVNPTQVLPCVERKRSLNLDIGAGSTSHPGVLALNYDVGTCVVIFDGRRHKLASFCADGIRFYRRPKVRHASAAG